MVNTWIGTTDRQTDLREDIGQYAPPHPFAKQSTEHSSMKCVPISAKSKKSADYLKCVLKQKGGYGHNHFTEYAHPPRLPVDPDCGFHRAAVRNGGWVALL